MLSFRPVNLARLHARSRALLLAAACLPALACGESAPPRGKAPAPDAAAAPQATAPSHGFNDAIAWRSLDEGLAQAAQEGRPLMLVVHASWCGKCKALRPAFQRSELVELSRKFVMVNADQDQTPAVLSYAPDGTYIPRVLFFDPQTGEVDPSLKNPRRDRHRYFYMVRDDIVGTMKRALERHGKS